MNTRQWLSSLARQTSNTRMVLPPDEATKFMSLMALLGFKIDAERARDEDNYELPVTERHTWRPGQELTVLQHWLFWTLGTKNLLVVECVPDFDPEKELGITNWPFKTMHHDD